MALLVDDEEGFTVEVAGEEPEPEPTPAKEKKTPWLLYLVLAGIAAVLLG